jgi:flagellar basal body-associated protein FliL
MHKEPPEKQPGNAGPSIPESAEITYNLNEGERPDGLKVRFKIKIATGAEARELDARQAETIRRLLQWAQQDQHSHPPGQD